MADQLILRLARPTDLAAVDELLARTYPRLLAPDYAPSVLEAALPIISRARPELLASGTYWLALAAEGAVVGAGGWTMAGPMAGMDAAATGHIRHVVTDADRVRQGIARRLMAQVINQAEGAGVSKFDCLSTRTAVPFYAATGFRVVGPVDVPLRPGIGFPAIRMQRG